MEWKRRKERKNRKREKSKWTGVESNLKWAHHVGGHVGQSAGYFANAFFEVLFHGVYVGRGVGRIAASGRVRGFFRLAVAEIVLRGNARRALKFIQTIFIFIILQIKIQLRCLEFALWKYFCCWKSDAYFRHVWIFTEVLLARNGLGVRETFRRIAVRAHGGNWRRRRGTSTIHVRRRVSTIRRS